MQGIQGKDDRRARQRRNRLFDHLNFSGVLIFHRLQVQHDAALMGEGAHRHHKVLVGSAVIAERTLDAFAIQCHPGRLIDLNKHPTPAVEQLNQPFKVDSLQDAAKRRVGRNPSLAR